MSSVWSPMSEFMFSPLPMYDPFRSIMHTRTAKATKICSQPGTQS